MVDNRDLLENQPWKVLYPKLLRFAIWQARIHGMDEHKGKDFAQSAIKRVFDGTRKWDPQRGDLLPYLKDTVKSIASKHLQLAYHKNQEEHEQNGTNILDSVVDSEPSADDILEIETLQNDLLNLCEDEEEELVMLDLFQEMKRKEIIDDLGLDTQDYDNIVRRIRRRVRLYLKARQPKRK